jgi:hypothetical protein
MRRALVLAVSLSVASSSHAAEQPPPTPPPPPPSGDITTVIAPEGGGVDRSNDPRLRWGVNAQLGWFFPQPMFTFGAEGRIGWSFSRLLAAYVSLGGGSGLFFGGSGNSTGATVSMAVMSQWYVGVMGELNLGDVFFIGAGPGIGRFSLAGLAITAGTTGADEQVKALGGWTPSLDLKLGFGFGRRNPESGRRGGFTLAIDVRAVFPTDSVYVQNGSSGQSVDVHRTGFGLAPMLMLGYDSR